MYNTMRITGLASGIDTEEMIEKLMQAEKVKVDRVEQDKQIALWRQEMYNDVNKDFVNFILNSRKDFGLTSVTYNGTFRANAYQNLNWVKKATSSDETKATVSSTAKAVDGSYNVEVRQLAEGVSMASGKKINGTGSIKDMLGDKLENKDKIKFEINGKTFVIGNVSDEDLTEIKKDGKVIGYEESFIKGDLDSIKLNDIAKLINSAKITEVPLDIRASYDSTIDRFFLQTTKTGSDVEIKITADEDSDAGKAGASFIEALNLQYKDGETYSQYKANDDAQSGKDAKINFSGANDIISSSNRITINGITMDLNDTGKFTVNIGTDVDGVYEKIEKFVNDYNELVDKTNKLLGEKRYRDYKPLTVEQKKAMEKGDIELWEEKAKSGLLRSDDIIYSTMLNTRRSIYDKYEFSGNFKTITEIGIGTEKYARGSAGGRLVIDEQKLKKAIADDPDAVMELLFKESTPEIKKEKDGKSYIEQEYVPGGLVSRIHDNLMFGMEEIIKKSGIAGEADLYRGVKGNILLEFVSKHSSISLLDEDVLQYNRRIDDLNTMLFRKENHYYAKFTAMEKAISRMNQQSMWLMQQFNG